MPNKSNDKSSGSDPRASARPSQTSELASSRPPDDADVGTFGDEPGLLDRVSSAAASFGSRAAEALEPSERDRSGGSSSLLDMDDSGGDAPSALERLGDGRDRGGSSALFDMANDSSGGPSAFDRLDGGRDRDRSSPLFDMTDDNSDGGMTAFDRLGDDDDTTAQDRLERLGEAEDSEDLYG